MLLSLGCASLYFIEFYTPGLKVALAAIYTQIVLEVTFLLLWGYALIKLSREVKSARQLIPNRKNFIIHGVLVTSFVFFYLVAQIAFQISLSSTGNVQIVSGAISLLLFAIINIIGILGFMLVIHLMLPITNIQI